MGETSGWSIRCIEGPLDTAPVDITEAGVVMGRAEGNTLVLNSGNVSRRHARVFLYQGVPYVQDLGSRNGVFVNGERIPEQALLGANDTVAVGEFRFQVSDGGKASPAAGAGGRSRKLMMAVGGGLVLLVAVIIGVMSSGGSSDGGGASGGTTAATGQGQGTGDLFDFKPGPGAGATGGAGAAGGQERQIDVASASLGNQGGDAAQVTAEQRNQMVKEYLDRGLQNQEQGRLKEAKGFYERAAQLDPGCSLCITRLERANREIEEQTQKAYDAALRYYNGMRYEEAVANWELVLNLQDDKNSEIYRKTMEYVAEARRKLEASRQ